jgi:MerR HTH family regulatory protein
MMSTRTLQNFSGRDCRVADSDEPRRLAGRLTTGDVARALQVTAEGVRYFVRDGQLACERTPSKLRLFREQDVLRFEAKRTQARIAGKLPPRRKLGPRTKPRQMFLPGIQLRVIRSRVPPSPIAWERSSKTRTIAEETDQGLIRAVMVNSREAVR